MLIQTLSVLQSLIDWDTIVTIWLNVGHSDYWDNFMEMVSGRFVWIPFYLSIVWMMLRNYSPKFTAICLAMVILLLVIDDQTCSSLIRNAIGRLRPSNLDNPTSAFIQIVDGYRGGRFGFPSAHATNSWGTAFFLIYVFRRRWLSLTFGLWSALLCYSRIYLGVHYFGDIMAGTLLGLVNASIVYFLFLKFLPTVTNAFRSNDVSNDYFRIPILVCIAEVLIMLVLAIFVDPVHGI